MAHYWINGFTHGVVGSSVVAESTGGKPVICPSENVTIGNEFLVENMERLVRERPDLKTEMWTFVALTALREAFPCK
jgi:hypothetical protein